MNPISFSNDSILPSPSLINKLTCIALDFKISNILTRGIGLLICFSLNFVMTTLADSSQLQTELYEDNMIHRQSTFDDDCRKSNLSSQLPAKDCNEHEECHLTHFHHYLGFYNSSLYIDSDSLLINFLQINQIITSTYLEIIKPPHSKFFY